MPKSPFASRSHERECVAVAIEGCELGDAALVDGIDHEAQRLGGLVAVRRDAAAAGESADEDDVPGLAVVRGFGDQRGEAGDFLRRLVHAQARLQVAALATRETGALRGGGIAAQFPAREHEQQALRFDLFAGGACCWSTPTTRA